MTEREQQYLDDCESMLAKVQAMDNDAGSKAVCIDALFKHIRKVKGWLTEPKVSSESKGGKMTFMVGLTHADMVQLQNLGTIEVNPKDVGQIDMPITIFLIGTHEHAAKGMEKHPDTPHKFLDTHGDTKN